MSTTVWGALVPATQYLKRYVFFTLRAGSNRASHEDSPHGV